MNDYADRSWIRDRGPSGRLVALGEIALFVIAWGLVLLLLI